MLPERLLKGWRIRVSANLSIADEFSMDLQLYDVLGLKPLGTLGDSELNLIAFVK